MVFIHIEKDGALNMHRMETVKTVKTVIADVVEEFGVPDDVTERDGVTRLMYGGVDGNGDDKGEWLVFINEIKRIRW